MADLLPCPFCGSAAKFNGGTHGKYGQITCTSDDCFGPMTTAAYKADSIDQWNRRAQPPQPTGTHVLYKTGDADAPDAIKDRNGEVVLANCRLCGRGEAQLSEPCDGLSSIGDSQAQPTGALPTDEMVAAAELKMPQLGRVQIRFLFETMMAAAPAQPTGDVK